MKKFNVIILCCILMFAFSCKPKADIERDAKLKTHQDARVIITKYSCYEIIEVYGHQYLSNYQGGIVHMESCPCKNK
jgi:hypothetical protein